ncbi:MAG: DinB family protein, partial [Eudoraea sp.]|nr:DinB family protein [Eudoraea sp.]
MKKVILPFLILGLVGFSAYKIQLTDAERNMALEDLNKTRDRLTSTVDGLSEEQLNFKSSPESWSIAECVEHLAISENAFSQMLQGAVQTPADPSKRDSVKMSDEQLMGIITSRDQKIKTSEPFEPSGKFGGHQETLDAFLAKREEHIAYVKTTEDDLRNHYGQLPFGTID